MSDQRNQVFISSILGNILEYYDFTVYSVFSIAIGKTFFPGSSELMQIIYSLGIFAVGFFTRPLGGILFGYIGDHFGRRIALIFSMLGMTIVTFCIGLTPGFEQIGYAAPILLVVLRLVQGLCISGEGAGSAIFVLEHFHNFKPGFVISLVQASNIAGTILASVVGIVIGHYLPDLEFAWRFAFLFGGLLGIAGFYLRLRVAETPVFEMMISQKEDVKTPIFDIFKNSWRSILITFFVGAMASSIVYLVKAYINIFYSNVLKLSNEHSLVYVFYTSFVVMIVMPLIGSLGDIVGKIKVIYFSTMAIFFLITPVMYLISSTNFYFQITGLTLLAILTASISGTAYFFVISLFETHQRFSGVGFSYNLGITFFGGTTPIIGRWLVETTSLYYSPGFYIMFIAMILIIIMKTVRIPKIEI